MNMNTLEGIDSATTAVDYASFIRQIEVSDIHMVKGSFENLTWPDKPDKSLVQVRTRAEYQNDNKGFIAIHRYDMKMSELNSRKAMARLSVVFAVAYSSEIPMDDQLFARFQRLNLPVNTWPYFREFAQNCFARMGWFKIIAPAFKVGIGSKRNPS